MYFPLLTCRHCHYSRFYGIVANEGLRFPAVVFSFVRRSIVPVFLRGAFTGAPGETGGFTGGSRFAAGTPPFGA
jgi:hypothetical protein